MIIYYIKVNNGWLLLHYCCFRIFVGSLHRYGQWALTLPWWSCLLNETFGIFLAVVNFLFNADNGYCCCHEDLRVCANNEGLSLPWWSMLSRRQWLAVVAAVIYYLTSSMDGRCECSSAMLVALRPSLPFWRIIYQSTEFAQWRLTRWEYIGVEASVGETDSSILMFEGWISSVVLSRVITWKRWCTVRPWTMGYHSPLRRFQPVIRRCLRGNAGLWRRLRWVPAL